MPDVVRAALAHYQFETLHPFSDGNGRLGRLIVVLQLMQYGAIHYPLLIVSPWFETRRRDYQDHLLEVSQTGNFDAWARFFAEELRAQAEQTVRRVEALLDYQDEMRVAIREGNVRGVRARIMEDIVGQPIISVPWAETRYGVSQQGFRVWSQTGSNRRPPACKAGALPAELWPRARASLARTGWSFLEASAAAAGVAESAAGEQEDQDDDEQDGEHGAPLWWDGVP
jgi:hypothetical protein